MKKVLSILTGIIFSCNLIAQSDGGSKYIAHFDGGKGFFLESKIGYLLTYYSP